MDGHTDGGVAGRQDDKVTGRALDVSGGLADEGVRSDGSELCGLW